MAYGAYIVLYLLDSTAPTDGHCGPSESRKVWIDSIMEEEGLGHWPSLV